MIYIRNLFNQDLRDGKQIAFPTEPSMIFFKFSFNDRDPERRIVFKFKERDVNSEFYFLNDKIIETRLYYAKSESRIDGELKQFLRDILRAKVDDVIVFRAISPKLYEFEFIPQESTLYDSFRIVLNGKNHEVILEELNYNVEKSYDGTFLEMFDEGKEFNVKSFYTSCSSSGLLYSQKLINRLVSSILTKPFVILTGLSGSGKTKLAQAFVQWICQDESQFLIIAVGADWTNREPLLGYPNALKPSDYVKPDSGVLDLIIDASTHPELPYFLILDEMNLSHVERYFADFLSVMESKEGISLFAEGAVENGVPAKLFVPDNLFFIGTVNIDETTNMFSPKVLDRANTIEFRVNEDEMQYFLSNKKDVNLNVLTSKGAGMAKSFLQMASNKSFVTKDVETINQTLLKFFGELKKTGAEFGYRSASEILRLIHQLSVLDETMSTNDKLDIAIMQKLLPKLHGSRRKLCPVLVTLGSFCIEGEVKVETAVFEKFDFDFKSAGVLYPISLEKIARMHRSAVDNGFSSFAEA